MHRNDLPDLLYCLIEDLGGSASMMNVFKEFWKKYETVLRSSGDLCLHGIMILNGRLLICVKRKNETRQQTRKHT